MSSTSDTRHIIRPEHFALAPQLLGLELARPSRRFAALMLDLLIVVILVQTAGGFMLAVAAAYAFFRFAARGGTGWKTRFAVRAAAALILFMVVNKGIGAVRSYGESFLADAAKPAIATASAGGAKAPSQPAAPGLRTALQTGIGVVALHNAATEEEARRLAPGVIKSMRATGMEDAAIRDALVEMESESGKPWMEDVVNGALPPLPAPVPADSLAVRYAAAVAARDTARADSLRPLVGAALAGDTVKHLRDEMKELRDQNTELEQRAEEAEQAAEGKGFLSYLKGLLDDLGIGFGWTGLYFTAFTALWKGQTPGKRLLGVRVVRLDGKPIGLWASFERFGGYAAGLVTGLLGFAQVFWDRNRQAIHDKISETVVIREREVPAAPQPAPPAFRAPERRAV
ncbi:MAG TPA: RDD family protein [Longimicrobium sp.]